MFYILQQIYHRNIIQNCQKNTSCVSVSHKKKIFKLLKKDYYDTTGVTALCNSDKSFRGID